jgi:hypothetical protein
MSQAVAIAVSVWEAARPVRHLAAWACYHSGARSDPAGRAARLTYYSSSSDDVLEHPRSADPQFSS